MSEFLTENLPHFDFALPFINMQSNKKVGREPWHISYLPLAELASQQFSTDILQQAWKGENILGADCLISNLEQIFSEYIV